jgi:uncharacterized protein (TIGR02996 family)
MGSASRAGRAGASNGVRLERGTLLHVTSPPEELLARVLADSSDAPRLAYADWCDAHGDPRGRFIRLQLGTGRYSAEKPDALALFAKHGSTWDPELRAALRPLGEPKPTPTGLAYPGFGIGYRRGFPAYLDLEKLDAAQAAQVAAAVRLAPIEEVQCRTEAAVAAAFFDAAFLSSLNHVRLGAGAEALSSVLRHASDRPLDFLMAESSRAFVEGPFPRSHVRRAVLRVAGFDLAAFLENVDVEALDLRDTGLDAALLAKAPRGAQSLAFGSDLAIRAVPKMAAVVLEALAGSAVLSGLREISLPNTGVGDLGAVRLATEPCFGVLEEIRLAEDGITSKGAAALASSVTLDRLRVLDLRSNPIRVEGVEAFRDRKGLPRLERLGLKDVVKLHPMKPAYDWDGSWVGEFPSEEVLEPAEVIARYLPGTGLKPI